MVIDPPHRADRTDRARIVALIHRDVTHDEALGGRVVDDVSLVEPTLWPCPFGFVPDLHE